MKKASVAGLLLQPGALVVVDVLLLVGRGHILYKHRIAVLAAMSTTEDENQSVKTRERKSESLEIVGSLIA